MRTASRTFACFLGGGRVVDSCGCGEEVAGWGGLEAGEVEEGFMLNTSLSLVVYCIALGCGMLSSLSS